MIRLRVSFGGYIRVCGLRLGQNANWGRAAVRAVILVLVGKELKLCACMRLGTRAWAGLRAQTWIQVWIWAGL